MSGQYYKKWATKTLQEMRKDPLHKYHGTVTGYNLGCDCSECRSKSVYKRMLESQKKRAARAQSDDKTLSPHGTASRYDYGCHCEECTAANTERQRKKRDG